MSAAKQHDDAAAGARDVKRRPARTNATRLKIFSASLTLIGERGHHAVTVDEIAAAAGISKGSVYYNFGSKSELIGQLLRFGTDILLERLREPSEAATAREELGGMVRGALLFIDDYPAFAQLWISEMWHSPSDWREELIELRGQVLGVVRDAVQRSFVERGVAPESVPAGVVDVTASALFGATLILGQDRQVFTVEHDIDTCVRTVLGSLDAAAPQV
ncbi:hypothetical protein BJH93_15555 [Kocuria polaris]|nr:hypothetical protein [Kocuria polaris]